MENFNILSQVPLLRVLSNVISKEICNDLINWARPQLVASQISSLDGKDYVNYEIRSASSVESEQYPPHFEHITDLVSQITNLDKSRFEHISVIQYAEDQEFKVHADYFIMPDDVVLKENNKRCEYGGNRVSTVIIYLNDVEEGGETWFPCLDRQVIPKQGKLCQFTYDYDEWQHNYKTQHCSLPIVKGEKWIMTIWVREHSSNEQVINFKKFNEEFEILNNLENICFDLECGPAWDRKSFNITLPANDSPMNGIAVPVTGGMESSLLLYIISVLNAEQKIPYQIIPVLAAIWHTEDGTPGTPENIPAIEKLIDVINQRIDYPKVKNIQYLENDISNKYNRLHLTLEKVFKSPKEMPYLKYVNIKYMFLGDNAIPTDNSHIWENRLFNRKQFEDKRWIQPFLHLQKYHIVDAILQLELLNIFENIDKCSTHKNLYEECEDFPCNERRWGFVKLGREDLGDKYLIYKDAKNEENL